MPVPNLDWKPIFLTALREMPVIRHACQAAGINRTTAWRARQADEAFAEAWDEAMEDGIDRAEQEALARAVDGWSEPVWHQGIQVGTTLKKSDSLLQFVLKGRRRGTYGDKTEVTGAGGGPLALVDETKKAARLAALLELAKARKDGQHVDLA